MITFHRFRLAAVALLALTAGPLMATDIQQTDWSGGPGQLGPLTVPGAGFSESHDVAWLAIPGQLSLAPTVLDTPVEHVFNDTYVRPFSVRTADIDGDGDTDVLGTSEFSNRVSLWLNDGQDPPTLTEQVVDSYFFRATGLATADFDGDGHLDILANGNWGIAWWQNDGQDPITWTEHTVASSWGGAWEIHAHDVDQDGRMDVVCQEWDGGEVAWWRNEGGSPVAWTKHTVADGFLGAHSTRVGDLDGDGDMDMVSVAAVNHRVNWYRNDGGDPVVWEPFTIRTGFSGARSVRLGDLDRDGDLDVVAMSWSNDVIWWRNDGGDPIAWHQTYIEDVFHGGHQIQLADLSGDGLLDVLGVSYTAHDVMWWENSGDVDVPWTPHLVDGDHYQAITCATGDIDGDGVLDVLATAYDDRKFSWWSISDVVDSGTLTGSILDTGAHGVVTDIDWSAAVPVTGSLAVSVRSGDSPATLGAWSAALSAPGNLAAPAARYLQYRVDLGTSDPDRSPILHDLRLGGLTVGVAMPPTQGAALRPVWPNPSNPAATVSFELADAERVAVRVFDVRGRHVALLTEGLYDAGYHQLTWRGMNDSGRAMPSGTYMARLATPSVQQVQKFTLQR